jgi:hypothetical protein
MAARELKGGYSAECDAVPDVTVRLAAREVTRQFGRGHYRPVCEECFSRDPAMAVAVGVFVEAA